MNIDTINENLATGNIDNVKMLPHIQRLQSAPFIFECNFGLQELPTEP